MLNNSSGIDLRVATGSLGEEDICEQGALWCPTNHATSLPLCPSGPQNVGSKRDHDILLIDPFGCLPFLSFLSPITFSCFLWPNNIDSTIFLLESPVGMHLLPESPSCKPSTLSAFIPNNKTVGG